LARRRDGCLTARSNLPLMLLQAALGPPRAAGSTAAAASLGPGPRRLQALRIDVGRPCFNAGSAPHRTVLTSATAAVAAVASAAAAASSSRVAARRLHGCVRRGVTRQQQRGGRVPREAAAAEKPANVVEWEREQEDERAAAAADRALDPRGPSDIGLAQLLTWARGRKSLIVNPKVLAKDGRLVASMNVSEGTPLLGVMPDMVLKDGPSGTAVDDDEVLQRLLAAAPEPEDWDIRLTLRLLADSKRDPGTWRPYFGSLPVRAASPLLWNKERLVELQDPGLRRTVAERRARLDAFYRDHIANSTPAVNSEYPAEGSADAFAELALAVAARALRGYGEDGGCAILAPMLDLVGPPPADAERPSCRVAFEEGEEGEDPIPVLYASRDLKPGEVLSRDCGDDCAELLLQHGVAKRALAGDSVEVLVTITNESAKPWQMKTLRQLVPELRPGRLPGDFVVPGKLRYPAEDDDRNLDGIVGDGIFRAAYLISAKDRDDFSVAEMQCGIDGIFQERRKSCLETLGQLIKGCRGEFSTTAKEDQRALDKREVEGARRIAVEYRLEKKRCIEKVLALLDAAAEDASMTGGLPFAVLGTR